MKREVITGLLSEYDLYSQVDEFDEDIEFWYARDLCRLLGYKWDNFKGVISKAQTACETVGENCEEHFQEIDIEVALHNQAIRMIEDLRLTRYACYLVAQNGDPHKEKVAFAMSYFAVRTRQAELLEQRLNDWERLQARQKLADAERLFSGIAFERGVDSRGFANIRSKGDSALFGGYNTGNMKRRLGMPANRPLADFLPSITIKAKDFAAEITSHRMERDESISGEILITREHVENNEKVRGMLLERGIKPEDLPAAEDIKKLQRRLASEGKKLPKSIKGFEPEEPEADDDMDIGF